MKKNIISNSTIRSLLFFFIFGSILSGCSTVSYVQPETGPVARVRFVSDSNGITVIWGYNSTNCDGEKEMMRLRNGFIINSDPRRLGIPLWNFHNNAAKELLIEANKPKVYMFKDSEQIGKLIASCGVMISQTFEDGKDYEINYKWNGGQCYVDINEIMVNKLGLVERILLQKGTNRLNNEFSDICIKKFQQGRLW